MRLRDPDSLGVVVGRPTPSLHDLQPHVSRATAQLIESERFVLVVPEAVIKGLDEMKHGTQRSNKGARDAIRYLEKVSNPGETWAGPHRLAPGRRSDQARCPPHNMASPRRL